MTLLILEPEIYLAESLSGKLDEAGYECSIATEIPKEKVDYDVILIASKLYDDACEVFIKRHSTNSIIIMMVTYTNDNTVNKPMLIGAKDYVIKPFSTDELMRKISHYHEFAKIKKVLGFYNAYFNFVQNELNTPHLIQYNPPFLIKSTSQRSADIYAMKYARDKNVSFDFITLKNTDYKEILEQSPRKSKISYITNLEELKRSERREFLESVTKYPFIISCVSTDKIFFPQIIDICHIPNMQEIGGDIMSVTDYVKTIITRFENRYPDVELAKKLGMSRKSLWEKRKKYELFRRKRSSIKANSKQTNSKQDK